VDNTQLDVYLDLDGIPQPVGQAWFTQRRGGPVTTVFAYSPDYLATPKSLSIDPALELVSGNQHINAMPGAFQDSAPDRWGRNLINKQHAASNNPGRTRDLNEVDYLSRVSDRTRQGALRFARPGQTTFIDPDDRVPKLIHLPRLLQASHAVDSNTDDLAAVKELLDAGSGSLGGARPKASVLDQNNQLHVAKFPHRDDDWDVMGWECVALDLADKAGITTPERNLVTVSGSHRALLLRRFDRTKRGNRLPYISAMTALAASDGEWHDYSDIAEALTDIGANVTQDLHALYRRVAFSVAIHNTDDHLRNHGFLATGGGWTLAPLFDVNPNPNPSAARVTSIAGSTTPADEQAGLVSLAEECRLKPAQAQQIRTEVAEAAATWPDAANNRGIKPAEIARFEDTFNTSALR
jgi:serine/threonine-protein kinase HipA